MVRDHLMRRTLPPVAETLFEAGGPRSLKLVGGRPLPRRRTGGGDVGGDKYSPLEELDASSLVGNTGTSAVTWCEAERGDEPGGGGCALLPLALLLVIIFLLSSSSKYFYCYFSL